MIKFRGISRQVAPLLLALTYIIAGTVGVISGGAWAGAGIAGALLTAIVIGVEQKRLALPDKASLSFVFVLLSAATLSCFGAVDGALAQHATLKMASILLPLLLLASPDLQKRGEELVRHIPPFSILTMGALTVLSVLLLQASTRFGPDAPEVTKLNRGFSYALMMFIPLFGFLFLSGKQKKSHWALLGGLLAFFVCGLLLTHSRATQLGVFIAFIVFLLALFRPLIVTLGLGFISLVSVGWPAGGNYLFENYHQYVTRLPSSWFHRVEIWDYLYHRIIENPLWGYGIGNAHKVDWLIPYGAMYQAVVGPASHPHNAPTQLWVEMGVPGILAGLFMAFLFLRGIWKLPREYKPFALAVYAYAFCLLMSAYNLWTDSLWAALALTVFAFRVLAQGRELKQS